MRTQIEIKKNLKTIKETRQLTNAMYLMSASTMNSVFREINYNERYMRRIRATVKDILLRSPDIRNMYIEDDVNIADGRCAVVVIGSDKGMCGGYNSDIAAFAVSELKKLSEPIIYAAGARIREALSMAGFDITETFSGSSQYPSIHRSRYISDVLLELYNLKMIDNALIIYTDYISAMRQEPVIKKVFPLDLDDFSDVDIEYSQVSEAILEPSAEAAFRAVSYQYMLGYVFSCLCQSYASEHISRMNSTQASTKNADEMIKKLEHEYNATRQVAITNDLTEIAAAAELMSI